MKKILIAFLICSFISGCGLFGSFFYNTFTVINETGHTIDILGYNNLDYSGGLDSKGFVRKENPRLWDSIHIDPFKEFTTKKVGSPEDYVEGMLFSSMSVDSVAIVFNNNRILVNKCSNSPWAPCDSGRNILTYDETNYDISNKKKKGQIFTYTITEEDYNNAVPIED